MLSDKRRHSRKNVISTVEFYSDTLNENEIGEGFIANISESGLCLLTTNHLNKGQTIKIQNSVTVSFQTATVRWSERYRNLYYKAGLEFTQ
jgi:hypothetical protein